MKTQVLPITPESVALAAKLLQQGELVALPTETVYGIAADATLGGAVDCAIPRMSDAGYDSTPDKKYVVAAQVDVTCKVFSACPREFKELVRNASRG